MPVYGSVDVCACVMSLFQRNFKQVFVQCDYSVVFFRALLSDPCPQTLISFGFWEAAGMDHTGPCRDAEGLSAAGEPFPQSLLVGWICELVILEMPRETWRGELGCVINAKIHFKGMLTLIFVAVR